MRRGRCPVSPHTHMAHGVHQHQGTSNMSRLTATSLSLQQIDHFEICLVYTFDGWNGERTGFLFGTVFRVQELAAQGLGLLDPGFRSSTKQEHFDLDW